MESSLSTRKEKVLITCVGILYSPIIMQSVEGQACPDATHFLMAGTQVCNTTVYALRNFLHFSGSLCYILLWSQRSLNDDVEDNLVEQLNDVMSNSARIALFAPRP